MMSVLETARTLYGCNEPQKKKAYFFIFLGNSMVNGYSSNYTQLSTADQNKYIAVEPMTQYKKYINSSVARIFDNLSRTDFSTTFGNYVPCGIDLYDIGAFNDGDIFCFEASANGSVIMNGEADDTWSKDDLEGYLYSAFNQIDFGKSYLEKMGYSVTIGGVNFSVGAGSTVSLDVDEYLYEYQGIISETRSYYDDENIPFVMGAVPHPGGFDPQGEYSNPALEAIKLNDSLVDVFYIGNYPPQANDTLHQRSQGVLAFGQFVASAFSKMKSGLSYPSASNVVVSGTLKVNQNITATWSFSSPHGASQGASRISLTYADDTSGTNEIWLDQHFEGSSKKLISTQLGKYIRARVEPVALTGPKTGNAVLSAWAGPVVA